jgi:hypothetical protein
MRLFDWWKVRLRRGAIRIAIRRPMPKSLTYGDRRNNNYQVRLDDLDGDFRFVPKLVLLNGLEGWCFVDNERRADASLPNAQLAKLSFEIIHHYREFTITTKSPALFIAQRLVRYPFFANWKQRIAQFLFNRRRLARQDRIAILRHIFDQTVENPSYRTSSLDLPSKIYGMRFWGRDDHDAHISYYEIVLDSLLESGDLQRVERDYALSPKAVATLDAHETQQERHRDNVSIQRTIALITVVLALLAAAQVGTTVWQELHPDPAPFTPSRLPEPVYPLSPPRFNAP